MIQTACDAVQVWQIAVESANCVGRDMPFDHIALDLGGVERQQPFGDSANRLDWIEIVEVDQLSRQSLPRAHATPSRRSSRRSARSPLVQALFS